MSPRHPQVLSGIGLAIAAVAFFATLDTLSKHVSQFVPVMLALWVRYLVQALSTTLVMLPTRGRSLLKTQRPLMQAVRGTLLFVSSIFAFFSLLYLPVAEFTTMFMVTPMIVTVLAARMLGERVSPLLWVFVIGGFLGILVIVRPGVRELHWSLMLPMALIVSSTAFQLLTSRLARTENPVTLHFYTGWTGAALGAVAVPFVWVPIHDPWLWLQMLTMGAMGAIGHYLLVLAYVRAPASVLMPYQYLQIGFAMLGGWLVFSHVPDRWSVLGMCLVAACGAGAAWLSVREQRRVRA